MLARAQQPQRRFSPYLPFMVRYPGVLARRSALPAALMLWCAATAQGLAAQDLTLERYERWKLHPAPGDSAPRISAQLYLFVRNNTRNLVKRWQAILVVRDTLGAEFFRLPLERDSADLGPGELTRLELRFNDQAAWGDPYDHLMANDTTNIVPTFDAVLVVESAPVGYVAAAAPVCFTEAAIAAVEAAEGSDEWREAVEAAGCHWAQQELAVEVLDAGAAFGARVRWQRLDRVVWIRRSDLRTVGN